MIPYFIWTIPKTIVKGGFSFSLKKYLFLCIKPSFWFLITLFMYCVTLFLLSQIVKNPIKMIVAVFIIYIVTMFLAMMLIGSYEEDNSDKSILLKMYAIYLPFFFGGYFWNMLAQFDVFDLEKKRISFSTIIVIGLYIISLFFYSWQGGYSVFSLKSVFSFLPERLSNIIEISYKWYVVAPLAIFSWVNILLIFYRLFSELSLVHLVSHVGTETLAIYVMSELFIYDWTGLESIDMLISILVGLLVPIVIQEIIERKKITFLYFLFGIKCKLPKSSD